VRLSEREKGRASELVRLSLFQTESNDGKLDKNSVRALENRPKREQRGEAEHDGENELHPSEPLIEFNKLADATKDWPEPFLVLSWVICHAFIYYGTARFRLEVGPITGRAAVILCN
jgi:hypothetical protein